MNTEQHLKHTVTLNPPPPFARIRDAMLAFNVSKSEGKSEPDCHFPFSIVLDSRNNMRLVSLLMFHKVWYIQSQPEQSGDNDYSHGEGRARGCGVMKPKYTYTAFIG